MLSFQDYPKHVDQLMSAAIGAADPEKSVRRHVRREGELLHIADLTYNLTLGRVFLVSVGKASVAMALPLIEVLADDLHAAIIISKKGAQLEATNSLQQHPRLTLVEGNHPVSGPESIRATQLAIQMLVQTGANDLVLFLISGGTSALLTLPVISLEDWQVLTSALLASGCTIDEFNTIRRQLDRVKGGGLAQMAAPSRCLSLILSDVVGNPLQAIGSGPTFFIEETAAEAESILRRYSIGEQLDSETWDRILKSLKRPSLAAPETDGHRNDHLIVGDVRVSAVAAMAKAMQLGFVAQVLTVRLEGEAREVGRVAASIAKDLAEGRCLILGGETTVTLRDGGLGGRNQELALAAAIALEGWSNIVTASFATDGEDGPTPAAGAVISGETVAFARRLDLDPLAFLDRNDSFHFFQHLDEASSQVPEFDDKTRRPLTLLSPGPTGTNVNDLLIILTYPQADMDDESE